MRVHRSASRLLTLLILTSLGVLVAGAIATGRAAFVGTHGVSMNPLYYEGDLVLVARAGSYRVGQVVAYRAPAKHIVVLHRIIGGDASGFLMKGDNNQSIDPTHPSAGQVVGRAVLHIPQGGLWLTRMSSPAALGLIAFALVASGGTVIQTRRRRRRAAMSRHANRSPRLTGPVFALPPTLRTTAAVAAALGVLGLALGALAWRSPPDTLARTSTQATRQMSFSYTAAVARTPAYDGTTVHSPDPVFRRLANTVELHLAYQGSPGSMSVAAELSTPSGWHSSVPLAAPASFTSDRYESTTLLDLNAFDIRAQSAAAVTGLPAGPLTVTILPTIHTAVGGPFTPTLKLNLTPLQLSLAEDAKSLTVQDSTTVAHTSRVERTLNLLGRHITVARARAVSAILALAAVLATALLALVSRHSSPASEGAAIRRRYAPLLASVRPITTPPNLPVIEVTEFATLATLAQRCGQLVLHWSRSDVETFILLDEGTTYRYRTGSGSGDGATAEAPAATASTDTRDHHDHPEFDSL